MGELKEQKDEARSGPVSAKAGQKGSEGPIIIVENWARFLFWIVLILAFGFLAINQGMGFFYKAHLLKQPCDICAELNPGVQQCIDNLNEARPSYWTPDGYTDPFAQEVKVNIPFNS